MSSLVHSSGQGAASIPGQTEAAYGTRVGRPWLVDRVRIWLERAEAEHTSKRCGGNQKCPWCRQWVNDFRWTRVRPLPDGFMDEIECGNCGGTSAWKWEIGFFYVGPLRPPVVQAVSPFGPGFASHQIALLKATTASARGDEGACAEVHKDSQHNTEEQ